MSVKLALEIGFRALLNIFTSSQYNWNICGHIYLCSGCCCMRKIIIGFFFNYLKKVRPKVREWLWMLKHPVLTWFNMWHLDYVVTVLKSCPPLTLHTFKCLPRTRLYLTPVRDEEAESQRKAKSRHARQTRRSTQVRRQRADRPQAFGDSPLTLNWCEALMWLSCRVWLWQSWKRPRGPTTCLLKTGTQKKEPLQIRAAVWWKAWLMTEQPK